MRTLAREHSVNPSTVVAALRVLESEKMTYSRPGSGMYRAPHVGALAEPLNLPTVAIDFTSGTPSPEHFPVGDFRDAINAILERDGGHAFAYPESQGYPPLRYAIAKYLSSQGTRVDAESIHITSGAQQAIFLLGQILLRPGDHVLLECPSYSGAMQVFANAGARLHGIPLRLHGIRQRELVKAQKIAPKLIYVIPNFHHPTGYSYSQEARQTLIAHARRYNYYIIEDDHINELYYTGIRPRTLWQDAPDRVLYIKSFSKIFMPGLRLGFLIVPEELRQALSIAKQNIDLGSSGLAQRALQLYLESAKWPIHLSYLRTVYSERATHLHKALKNHLGERAVYAPLRGGMNCWIGLPKSTSTTALHRVTSALGVDFTPGEQYNLPPYSYHNHLRVSIASTNLAQIDEGIAVIGQCLSRLLQ